MKEMQELIEALELAGGYLMTALPRNQKEWMDGIPEIIERADKAIAAARASEGGWIDVKDRLPTAAGIYLVFYRYPDAREGEANINFADFDEYGNTEGELVWEDESVSGLYTHWRPLPSPPPSVNEVQK